MAWWIFQNLVSTAALAGVVALICRFGRLGPVARHALWVLVLVKFVTPPLVVWPWAAPDPLGLAKVNDRAVAVIRADAGAGVPELDASIAQPFDEPPKLAPAAARTDEPGPEESAVWSWLLALWVAGTASLLVIGIARLAGLARRVRDGDAADATIERRVIALAKTLGVRPVPVVTLAGSTSPVVWCLGRPRLLWPAALTDSSTDAIDGLIVHELAHVERRDHVVGWIELVAGLVWWWNPLFWSVRRALREQAELACDAWVISALPNGRRAYAESLLTLSSLGAAPSPSMAAVVGVRASSRRVLERRLVMIMKGRAPLRLPSVGLFTLAVLAMVTLPAWGTGAAEATGQQAPATQPAQSTKPAPEATTGAKPAPVPAQAQTVRPTEQYTVSIAGTHEKPARRHTFTFAPKAQAKGGTPAVFTLLPTEQTESQKAIRKKTRFFVAPTNLTDEGQNLVKGFDADRDAIQKEADAKIQARREAVIKELQALQDQYATAGKLDEAVAIRDFLKAGGPNQHFSLVFKR